jgi:hypothetical protein
MIAYLIGADIAAMVPTIDLLDTRAICVDTTHTIELRSTRLIVLCCFAVPLIIRAVAGAKNFVARTNRATLPPFLD